MSWLEINYENMIGKKDKFLISMKEIKFIELSYDYELKIQFLDTQISGFIKYISENEHFGDFEQLSSSIVNNEYISIKLCSIKGQRTLK